MPLLSFNEIRSRAIAFSREWADASREQGEAQSFWNDLLHVYGISRRRVATFEERVDLLDGGQWHPPQRWRPVRTAPY